MPDADGGPGARLFTVAPERPFLDTVAAAILGGGLPTPGGRAPDPLALTDITILLPTRRAARALQEAFLARAPGRALLLPRIRPIAAEDDQRGLIAGLLARPESAGAPLPAAISGLERVMVLTRLVLAWSRAKAETGAPSSLLDPYAGTGAATPAQAMRLAVELARLMDTVETEGVSLAGIERLVDREDLAAHWQHTLDFLSILTGHWPAYLAERGLLSPMERRNRQLVAEAERLERTPLAGPVIVAGVTGSIPAAARLIGAVARLPRGAVVLPALDLGLDEDTWAALAAHHPEHAQFGLAHLLTTLGVSRTAVVELESAGGSRVEDAGDVRVLAARRELVREALRPPAGTARWHDYAAGADRSVLEAGLQDVSLIEAASDDEEAEAVALILRQALETPAQTAALVTPDRILARRVGVRLEAWGIRVDDSAGRPLAKTMPGAFLDLVVAAAAGRLAPVAVMALLKHPLTRLGLPIGVARRATRALEIAVFRVPYLGDGIDGIRAAFDKAIAARGGDERRHRAFERLWDQDLEAARDLVTRLEAAMAPLLALFDARAPTRLATLARAHTSAAEALAQEAEGAGELWQGEAGATAAGLLAGLLDPALPALDLLARDYPDVWRNLVTGEAVRPIVPTHPRVFIWGPMEARLLRPDVVVLGGLNEGTWPEVTDPGPWLNRAMRKTLGLPSPEEATGRAAHDLTCLLGAGRVYFTRAQKVDGVPRVPSRWLLRLEALLTGLDLRQALRAGADQWLALARLRDRVGSRKPILRPEPRPPVALRPRRLSVSAVERWIANPYAIFASHILGLEPLDALGPAPDARLRGSIVHEVMGRFAARHPTALPADPRSALAEISAEVIGELRAHRRVAAFWLPRLARFADWFADTEPERRQGMARVHAEVSGRLVLEAPAGPFTLTARADRIDQGAGRLIISDYKTGQLPSRTDVLSGRAPQLPLESAIATAEGFAGVGALPVTALRYIAATGGLPAGEEVVVAPADLGPVVDAIVDGLAALVARFDDPATPYAPARRTGFNYRFDAYAHLARVAEWSGETMEEE